MTPEEAYTEAVRLLRLNPMPAVSSHEWRAIVGGLVELVAKYRRDNPLDAGQLHR